MSLSEVDNRNRKSVKVISLGASLFAIALGGNLILHYAFPASVIASPVACFFSQVVISFIALIAVSLTFGRSVMSLRWISDVKVALNEANYFLVIASIVQIFSPLYLEDTSAMLVQSGIGLWLLATFFLRSYWTTFFVLTAYVIYLLIQNVYLISTLFSMPSILALFFEIFFLAKMAVLKSSLKRIGDGR